jgi:hypothetical protein
MTADSGLISLTRLISPQYHEKTEENIKISQKRSSFAESRFTTTVKILAI